MFFEKFVNSTFYKVIDYIVRIIWLNVLSVIILLLGLFVFTIGPVILAGVYTIKLMLNKYEGPIFRLFFKTFKRYYKKATILSLLFIGVGVLLTFNLLYFINQMEVLFTWFDFVSFMLTLIILMLLIPAYFHSLLIYSCYEESSIKDLILDGFKLSFVYVIRGLLLIAILIGISYLVLLIPVIAILFINVLTFYLIEIGLFRAYDKISVFENKSKKKAEELLDSSRL